MKLTLSIIAALATVLASGALPEIRYEQFATGLSAPTMMLPYRDGDQAFLVVEQPGTISLLGEEGGQPTAVFLDLRDKIVTLTPKFDERGVLGLAYILR